VPHTQVQKLHDAKNSRYTPGMDTLPARSVGLQRGRSEDDPSEGE
jgi:hypothetical protein